MTGIGGQGMQLAAAVLARAAVAEGREVQVFGSYGGMMRGGATEATVVVADGPVEAPPTVGEAWSADPHAPRARRACADLCLDRERGPGQHARWSTRPCSTCDGHGDRRGPGLRPRPGARATSWPRRWS